MDHLLLSTNDGRTSGVILLKAQLELLEIVGEYFFPLGVIVENQQEQPGRKSTSYGNAVLVLAIWKW